MTQPAKSQEPSMEEILASIRRIIADDDASKSAPPRPAEPPQAAAPAARPAPPPPAPPPTPPRVTPPEPSLDEAVAEDPEPMAEVEDQASDILDLTEQMAAPMPPPPAPAPKPAPQFRTIDGSFDVSYEEEKPAPHMPMSAPQMPAPQMPEARAPLPSEDNPYRGDGRSNQLLSNVTSAAVDSAFNTLAQTVLVQNARTLEDLVREMLRPMLKAWLDDNLPGMVERLVRAEIERVSRGRMG
jgi:cell pole-organizing protein PopZ